MFSEIIIKVLEIIGTVSFAVQGALVAIKARLDVFGVLFIGAITAIGGGIVRDLLIGRVPPAIFTNLPIFLIAAFSSLITFVLAYVKRNCFENFDHKVECINLFFDAAGLAAFTVIGTEVAFAHGFGDNMFLSVVLGMFTGVGGGIFRDILTGNTPYVLKKHIYALASIGGACVYYLLRLYTHQIIVITIVPIVIIVATRLLAAKYRWSLPRIQFK